MSTLSATGAWVSGSRSFERSLAELKAWRDGTAQALAEFRRWAVVARLLDEQTAQRLAHLERRLLAERLTVAFVAEYSRGKSELINALFFADFGHPLLPSGPGHTTRCATEIGWDPARPPSLRLLPIGTREQPKALREYLSEAEGWTTVEVDPARPESLASACEAVSESIEVDASRAADLGFRVESAGLVRIPRWRYAMLNFPHRLLADGLTILDTPGHNTLGTEPELTLRRVPDSAAIVFMLTAETGLTPADAELWAEHIAPIDGLERSCFVVLNKIDALRDGARTDAQVLAEIDRRVRDSAEALAMEPTRVFALSARLGLAGKIGGDSDALLRSRLYRLEQALARRTIHERRSDYAAAVRAELRAAVAEARALIRSRADYAREQEEALAALQGRNQKLVEALARKASQERLRIEQARATLMGLRTVHNRHADELARLLDPNAAREAGIRARRAVVESTFSSGIGGALDAFFSDARERIRSAVAIIGEARTLMGNVRRAFERDYRIAAPEAVDFATDRFLVEIDRLEERCARDFKGASLLLHRRKTLGALFFDTVALKIIHVFEIADREVRTWMNAFIRPLEGQVNDFQERANSRIEGMGRIQNAETDLLQRLEELRRIAAEIDAQREQLEAHDRKLRALVEEQPERSLA